MATPRAPDQMATEIIRVLQDAMRRLRALEESQRVLEAKQVTVENNLFRKSEEMRLRAEAAEAALKDINTKFLKLENETANIRKFLSKVATKPELEEFKNYLDLLSPLRTHYTTEADVKKMIEEHRKK